MKHTNILEIQIDCFDSVYRNANIPMDIEEILTPIATHHDLESRVNSIRSGEQEKRDVLPIFIPSQTDGQPTGLIQIDYDAIKDVSNSEILKKQFEEHVPSLVYAFTSPSGGLKALISTDFYGNDADANKFKFAVQVVETEIRKLLNDPDIEFDSASKNIGQPCFFSYDDSLVYNSNPAELPVKEKADQLFNEWMDAQSKRIHSIEHKHTIDLHEVISAFHAIPKDIGKNARYKRVFPAILNVFGGKGIEMILDHFLFKNLDKAREGVELLYQKTFEHTGANKPGIRTIIEEARKYNWISDVWSGRREKGLTGSDPTYHANKYDTVRDAVERLENTINNYFETGVDTLIHAECGLGKTKLALMKVAKIDGTVAIFIPEHDTAREIQTTLHSLDVHRDDITIISGYAKTCNKLDHLDDSQKEGLSQNWQVCGECEHYNVDCRYHIQFQEDVRIRIYPHAYLFYPSSVDKFKPDFVIIDESIIGNICTMSSYRKKNGSIFEQLIRDKHPDIDELKHEISRRTNMSGKPNDRGLIPPPAISFNSERWNQKLQENRQLMWEHQKIMHLKELLQIIQGKHSPYMIWRDEEKVFFGMKKQIADKWLSKPILHLDASGDRTITEIVFEKKFPVYEKIRCQYADGVKIVQVFDKVFSKGQCAEEKTKSGLKWLASMLDDTPTGFVGYNQIDGDRFITDIISDHKRVLWYGGLRGKNRFENSGCDSMIMIGRNMISHKDLVNIARIIFRKHDFVSDRVTVTKTYRMKDHNHYSASFTDYADKHLQALSEVFDKSESYQGGHRSRLLHQPNRTLLLLTREVLDFTIDDLVCVEDIIPSKKRRKLIEAVKKYDGKIPLKKNKIIMQKTGLSENQVKSIKSQHMEWVKGNYWFYVDAEGMFRYRHAH